MLTREQRENEIKATFADIDAIMTASLKAFQGQSTDQQKFISASMYFDLCFNIPVAQYQARVMKQVISRLTDRKIAYQILQRAYDKLESYSHSQKFDPVLEALYAANLVSTLENEDWQDAEMQNLFSCYSDSYMLVSVNSSLVDEIIHF